MAQRPGYSYTQSPSPRGTILKGTGSWFDLPSFSRAFAGWCRGDQAVSSHLRRCGFFETYSNCCFGKRSLGLGNAESGNPSVVEGFRLLFEVISLAAQSRIALLISDGP